MPGHWKLKGAARNLDGQRVYGNSGIAGSPRRKIAVMSHQPAERLEIEAAHSINQRIFETSLDLILVVDRQGNFIRVSPSSMAIIGYPPEDLVGHSAAEFLYPDDLESTRQEMRLARRGQVTRNFDTRYVHKDGSVVPLTWTGVWSGARHSAKSWQGRSAVHRPDRAERFERPRIGAQGARAAARSEYSLCLRLFRNLHHAPRQFRADCASDRQAVPQAAARDRGSCDPRRQFSIGFVYDLTIYAPGSKK